MADLRNIRFQVFIFLLAIAIVLYFAYTFQFFTINHTQFSSRVLRPSFFKAPNISQPTVTSPCKNSQDFFQTITTFDWKSVDNDAALATRSFINSIMPWLTMPPLESVAEECQPMQLPPAHCPYGWTALDQPRKIIHSVKFAFEADTLEIHLNEIGPLVDYFVITESIVSHQQLLQKPLLWERIKSQARFQQFLPKILHFVLDDSDVVSISNEKWASEFYQERIRWLKLRQWNEQKAFLEDNDLIGFGDADEIASQNTIHILRHCDFPHNTVDVGIWFPYGRLNTAFRTDFPLRQYPYTLGNPTFWKYKSAIQSTKTPSYLRGQSRSYILGGMHLTEYQYLPVYLAKSITGTEMSLLSRDDMERWTNKTFSELLPIIDRKRTSQFADARIIELSDLFNINPEYRKVVQVPYLLSCNPKRYPAWHVKEDSRYYKKICI